MSGDASPKVFREPGTRTHAPFAVLGAVGWTVLLVWLLSAGTSVGLEVLFKLAGAAWMFGGVPVAAWLAQRADRAIASRRGDLRSLAKPNLAALGAFAGGIVALVMLLAVAVLAGLSKPVGTAAVMLAPLAGSALGAWLLGRPTRGRSVELGSDALRYDDGRRTVVVPWRALVSAHRGFGAIELRVRDARGEAQVMLDGLGSQELLAAIERAVRDARDPLAVGAMLRRDDRPVAQWREALRAKALGANDFRAQALDRDDLVAALTHPAATPEERVGAALALRDLDDEGASRVRVAAEAVMEEETREALRAVADDRIDARAIERVTRGG